MLGDSGASERSGEIYLPYVGHVADQVVLLRDGSMMAMGHAGGVAFELEEPQMRNARLRNLNTLFRNIADDNVTICRPDPPSRRAGAAAGKVPFGLRRRARPHLARSRAE